MYQTPRLERFGPFRDLTKIGFSLASDGCTIIGANGNTGNGGNYYATHPFCRPPNPTTS
jgi:hypothetical protein